MRTIRTLSDDTIRKMEQESLSQNTLPSKYHQLQAGPAVQSQKYICEVRCNSMLNFVHFLVIQYEKIYKSRYHRTAFWRHIANFNWNLSTISQNIYKRFDSNLWITSYNFFYTKRSRRQTYTQTCCKNGFLGSLTLTMCKFVKNTENLKKFYYNTFCIIYRKK